MPRIFHVPNVSLNVSDAPDTPLDSGEDLELAVACDKVLDTFCHLMMYRNQFSEILVFHSTGPVAYSDTLRQREKYHCKQLSL